MILFYICLVIYLILTYLITLEFISVLKEKIPAVKIQFQFNPMLYLMSAILIVCWPLIIAIVAIDYCWNKIMEFK